MLRHVYVYVCAHTGMHTCTCACMNKHTVVSLALSDLGESAAEFHIQPRVTTLSEMWGNWMEFREEHQVRLKGLEGLRD